MFATKKVTISFAILTCIFIAGGSTSLANGPRSFFKGLFRTESGTKVDQNEDFYLDETKGPWMIYVKCYGGATAREDALELAKELRQKHQLYAYVFHNKSDYAEWSAQEDRRREKEIRETLGEAGMGDVPIHMPRQKESKVKVAEEYAVVVGNFQSINDNDINKTFEKIKKLESDCVVAQMQREIAEAERTGEFDKTTSIELLRMTMRDEYNNSVYPFAKAIKCPNPVLPLDYFSNRVDEFVQKLNENSRYSLLQNRGKYTIKVGEFSGSIVADPKQIDAIEKNEKLLTNKSKLERAGDKAENMCEALRQKGWEAYTFHDRTRSIVTVGSFNSLGQADRDGTIVEYDPRIVEIYGTFSVGDINQVNQAIRTSPDEPFQIGKSILNIPFLPHPEPMEVPRPLLSYNRNSR